MRQAHLSQTTGGWLAGQFTPAVIVSSEAELAIVRHPANSPWAAHYQKQAVEVTCVLQGYLLLNHRLFGPGDLIVVEPRETIQPEFLTEVVAVVLKYPSAPQDKVEVPCTSSCP